MGGHHTKVSGGHRGKPYALMLLLAFGAALLGVMTLHKFRERRIVSHLLKNKDRELYSLNLLLQKQKERNKEINHKTEEMKTKIYTLRSQKMELDNQVLDMKYTINALKEVRGKMETALEEKQEEVKILRKKETDSAKKEILKQKDTEIEDLKRRLASQVNVWSVSSDDPSNKEANATNTNIIEPKHDETEVVSEAKDDESSIKSDGGGGSMARGTRKGKKLRPLTRKRTRNSANPKHRSSDEERSKDSSEEQILIKRIYESDKEVEIDEQEF